MASGFTHDLEIRALHPADAESVHALVRPEIERTRYPRAPTAALDAVLDGSDADSSALVALMDGSVAGIVIHGVTAGSEGAGRIQLVVTAPERRRTGIARALIDAAMDSLRRAGARVVFIEMPDDPTLAAPLALFRRCGFHVESRVAGFYRDGVDLVVLRREMGRD